MKCRYEEILAKRGYVVSEEGQAYNKNGKKVGSQSSSTYIRIKFRNNTKSNSCKVHRLQAYQKFGDKIFDENVEVRHLDGNPLNNSWDNIGIGTHSDNMMDIPKQVRIKRALHATSFVRKYNKEEVKSFHSISKSYKITMERFNITSKGTLHYILKN